MAETFQTLSQLVTLNDQNLSDVEANNLFDDAPFLRMLPAVTASNGTKHSWLQRTTAGSAGFRAVNAGYAHTAAVWDNEEIELALVDGSYTIDKAQVLGDSGRESVLAKVLRDKLRTSFYTIEQQLFQGNENGDATGFKGFNDYAKGGGTSTIIDASGSAAGATYSAYLVRVSQDDVIAVAGNGGVIEVGSEVEQRIEDSSGNPFTAIYQSVLGYAGLQIGSDASSVVRIANCDASNKLTDDLLYQALSEFPAGSAATHIVMPRVGLRHLREGRTAHDPTGKPAAMPSSVEGLPIVVTDGISTTLDSVATS